MHDCRKFREQWLEQAIGPTSSNRSMEAGFCPDCRRFMEETLALNDALNDTFNDTFQSDTRDLESGESWNRFATRFRAQVATEPPPRSGPVVRWLDRVEALRISPWLTHPRVWAWGALAVAILAVATWRLAPDRAAAPQTAGAVLPLTLDAQTVEFLGRSEMFLRDFTKLLPSDGADLEDARNRARNQLAAIAERKAAVVAVPPVWNALEEYETVLREIKNLDARAGQDVEDIQSRIARRGLITTMKVYQPTVRQADFRLTVREN
ncbi:MAG TPA: hypothetical protein VFY29_20475 [Terriglobia bacterium]|nr:hypothetical protein [Terriglobia bacterium]